MTEVPTPCAVLRKSALYEPLVALLLRILASSSRRYEYATSIVRSSVGLQPAPKLTILRSPVGMRGERLTLLVGAWSTEKPVRSVHYLLTLYEAPMA